MSQGAGELSQAVTETGTKIEAAAEAASTAAQKAPNEAIHETMSSVSQALNLLNSEIKRLNDHNEYLKQQEQVAAAVPGTVAAAVENPPVEIPAPPVKKVRRGFKKVEKR